MGRFFAGLLWLTVLVACGSPPAPAESESPAAAPSATPAVTTRVPAAAPLAAPPVAEAVAEAPPIPAAPTAAEIAAAQAACNRAWGAFQAGDLATACPAMDVAIAVLARAEAADARRVLGACLYNRGRCAEAEGHPDEARALYERSLDARPNAVVEARLASLPVPVSPAPAATAPAVEAGARATEADFAEMPRPSAPDAAMLWQHADNPCRGDPHCAFTVSPASIYGSDLRVVIVEVWRHDEESGDDLASWRGRQGASLAIQLGIAVGAVESLRWGPTVWAYRADLAESVEARARIEFVDLHDGMAPLARVIVRSSITEICCGGRATSDRDEHVFCGLHEASEPSQCAHALAAASDEGRADDPDDEGYSAAGARYRARLAIERRTLRVTATEGRAPALPPLPPDRHAEHHRVAGTFDLSSL